jgi:hypothetical protein
MKKIILGIAVSTVIAFAPDGTARAQSASMVGNEIKQMRMAERLAAARAQHRFVMRRLGARCNN